MSGRPVDRDLVSRLLDDAALSYREIGRRANCSDFAIREIARALGKERRMKRARSAALPHDDEPLGLTGWAVLIGICAVFIGALWFAARKAAEGGAMP